MTHGGPASFRGLGSGRLVVSDGLGGELVELAGLGVAVDFFVEEPFLELVEPGTKLRELLGREALDGPLDVLQLGHAGCLS